MTSIGSGCAMISGMPFGWHPVVMSLLRLSAATFFAASVSGNGVLLKSELGPASGSRKSEDHTRNIESESLRLPLWIRGLVGALKPNTVDAHRGLAKPNITNSCPSAESMFVP